MRLSYFRPDLGDGIKRMIEKELEQPATLKDDGPEVTASHDIGLPVIG